MTDHSTARALDLIAFLKGEGELDGCWFGDDTHPPFHGRFWWRKDLDLLSTPPEGVSGEVVERVAKTIHDAMVYAVREFKGEPQPWQNGNSTAESYARREARDILAALQSRVSPQEGLADKIAAAMQQARDEIGATEQQRIAFAYAEAAMRSALSASNPDGQGPSLGR